MTDPKTAIKVELARREMTLTALAEKLGVPQQSLSRTLRGSPVNQKSHWPSILKELGLKVVLVPDTEG